MRGSSRPGNVEEACSVCGECHTTTGLGVHMARAHGVVHRRTGEGTLHYRASGRDERTRILPKKS